jgi:hypothetical protein
MGRKQSVSAAFLSAAFLSAAFLSAVTKHSALALLRLRCHLQQLCHKYRRNSSIGID